MPPPNPLVTSCCGLQGEPNLLYLKDNGVSFWDDWADERESRPVMVPMALWPAPMVSRSTDRKVLEMIAQ